MKRLASKIKLFTLLDPWSLCGHICSNLYWRIKSNFIRLYCGFGKDFQTYQSHRLRALRNCSIGMRFRADTGLWMECIEEYAGVKLNPNLVIGDNFLIGRMGHIGCAQSIEIGDDVLIGSFVLITDHGHGDYSSTVRADTLRIPPIDRPLKCRPVRIGNSVWMGDHVSIMPGAEIGDGAVIGAGAVISGKIEPGAVVVGPRENKIS
jgi:acetyltransferase-like isoleucine patch superfamily enzyme